MKIKKNDTVQIIAGKDKGKKGKVLQVLPKKNRVIVEGINMTAKNVRPKKMGEKGQVVRYNAPIHISNVKRAEVQKAATTATKAKTKTKAQRKK